MSVRFPNSYDDVYSHPPHEEEWRLSSRDRVLPPTRRGRGKVIAIFMAVMAAGAGAYEVQSPEPVVPAWLRAEAFALLAALQSAAVKATAAPASEPPATANAASDALADSPAPPLPPPAAPPPSVIEAPPVAAAPVVVTTAALPPTAVERAPESDTAKPATPTDPLRLKAEAVGLHPDLSRALLERLTPADFQNAGAAVAKALEQASEDAVTVWPQRAKAGAAIFEVRFVPGAPSGCRRYIVGILKDRWTTTAMPVDKCGLRQAQAQRK